MPVLGARVLLLGPDDRALLLLSIDPGRPGRRWWDLPGGKSAPGETPADTARRELAEETGFEVPELGCHLWDREVWHYFRGTWRHRRDRVFLARVNSPDPVRRPARSTNEQANLIEARWWTLGDMAASAERFLPANLPELVAATARGALRAPLDLYH